MVHQEGSGSGGGGRTNFIGLPHQQLLNMHQGANPSAASTLGETFVNAGQILAEAADTLRLDLDRVEWEGAAADSFRDWGHQFATATLHMAQYTTKVGSISGNLGVDMGNVQIPPLPTQSIAFVNEAKANPAIGFAAPAQAVMVTAHETAIKADQLEAAQQMTRLASSYDVAASQLATMTPPTFPPPPNVHSVPIDDLRAINGPDSGSGSVGSVTRSGKSSTTKPGSGDKNGSPGSVSPPPSGNGTAPSAPGWIPGSQPGTGSYTPPADLGLAGVETLPRPETAPPATTGPTTTGPVGPGQSTHGPGPSGPPITGTPPITTTSSGKPGRIPGISGGTNTVPNKFTGPTTTGPTATSTPGRPMNTGPTGPTTGGRQVTTGGGTGPRQYGRGPSIVGGQPPSTAPQNNTSRGGMRTGIEGGQPARNTTGPHGEPGRTQGGRSPMGMGGSTAPQGSSPRAGSTGGSSTPRTPGGTLGGQPQSGASSRAFSPGGTGLRSGAPEGNRSSRMGGIGGPATSDEERRRRRERADYLEEDESTWTTRDSTVPPVVD
ncbi:hypothetical protein [Yinghuangia soli]|uniref:hypothetical protein n=1 Tax=Yinghuangia soli TaxID=2908204 RepID=UPI002285D6C1|nr:hypothetical protein [Yinghuangia soli]